MTLYDRIKAMSLDEMVSFFGYLNSKSVLEIADGCICRRCKADHGGHCPVGDDDKCLFEMSDKETIRKWLEGGQTMSNEKLLKSEVAREIFEEIAVEIQEALNSNYRAKPHIAESEELYHIVEGKIAALSGMEDFIAELKEKYIPTDEKEGCTTCKYMVSCEPNLFGVCDLYEREHTDIAEEQGG